MIASNFLERIFGRLTHDGSAIFSADEIAEWPSDALELLVKNGFLRQAQTAQIIECTGCEENCMMPVQIIPTENNRPARVFIWCDKRNDVGRIPVKFSQLEQWQMTSGLLAGAVASLLGFKEPPQENSLDKYWMLGLIKGSEQKGEVRLLIDDGVSLDIAGQNIPLTHILRFNQQILEADREVFFRLTEGATQQPLLGVGSPEWRKKTAKLAADAKHNQSGGSRDKKQKIREMWATGKYSSRDLCAEQECAALDMSFSTARKALRNTPNP